MIVDLFFHFALYMHSVRLGSATFSIRSCNLTRSYGNKSSEDE